MDGADVVGVLGGATGSLLFSPPHASDNLQRSPSLVAGFMGKGREGKGECGR